MLRPGRPPSNRLWVFLAALALTGACSSAGSSCAGLSPLPGGARFPESEKTENIANLRLTQDGIAFLNANWQDLLKGMLPEAGGGANPTIAIPLKCQVIGSLGYIVDNGHPVGGAACNSTGCGWADKKCDLNPNSATCRVNFNTAHSAPGDNTLKLGLQFTVDQKWFNLIDLKVTQLDGVDVCGDSGDGGCIDPEDIQVVSPVDAGTCSDWTCSAVSFFKDNVAGFLSPMIHDAMIGIVNNQFCEPCGALGQAQCPSGSFCSGGTCVDSQNTDACVPRLLGVEGRATLATFVQDFGVPPDAQLDLSIGLGSSADVNEGVNLGMRGGLMASAQNACVPAMSSPTLPSVPVPQFDRDAPADASGYHMALGLSQPFLSQALFQAQQSGALCLDMTTASLGMLNTGLIKTFLPSLGQLATRDGLDAPMQISLRPGAPPSIDVGAGTVDPVTGKALEPLITLEMPRLSIDFYAEIDDRLARLFTITADVAMPLSMSVTGCSGLAPAFGDLQQLVTNVSVTNSELIAEDPSLLGDLVPLALGMAQPAIAQLIKPVSLPNFGNFKLQVNAIKGINAIASQPGKFYHLAVYGTLLPAAASCSTVAPRISASVERAEIPQASEMTLTGKALPVPAAVLDVDADGGRTAEYSYRVDQGFWSEFHPAVDGRLRVSRAAFLLQGTHQIDVRARFAGDPKSVSPAVRVPFRVDWEPPQIAFVTGPDQRIEVRAHDVISGPQGLRYAYKLGEGAWSDFGPARALDEAAIRQAGGVSVRVQDEVGNVAERSWKGLTTLSRAAPAMATQTAQGCTAPGLPGGLASLLAFGAWVGLRRRSRR